MNKIFDEFSPIFILCSDAQAKSNSSHTQSYGERIVKHYELEYIITGTGYILVNDIPIPTVPKTLNFRHPGMRVEGIGIYQAIYIQFDLNLAIDSCIELEKLPIVYQNINSEFLHQKFMQFSKLSNPLSIQNSLLFKSYIFNILYEMYNDYTTYQHQIYVTDDVYSNKIRTAILYIQQHYFEAITLEDLANEANYSIYHFSRLFKDTTGWTPIQYVSQYRINKAKRLLLATDLTVESIITKCGFNNFSYFYRTFKKIYGMSPQEYRLKQ